jgi:enoyl-CoA hydratase
MNHPVRYAVADGVATITLDAPAQRNALSDVLVAGLQEALANAVADDGVHCVVLASSHESVWCAGGDLNTFDSDQPLITKHQGFQRTMELFESVASYPKPSIAALNGHALAGGMGLACCCDLLIASERATLGTPEINVGLFPFMIMAVIFRALPQKRANELLMRGGRITAREAHELGLVNHVVRPEEFEVTVDEWASSLAAKSPLLMQLGKRAMVYQRDLPLREALEYLRSQLSLAQSTDDIREGVEAFFAKREPVWSGR